MIQIRFIGGDGSDLASASSPIVPREGETVAIDMISVKVTKVRYQFREENSMGRTFTFLKEVQIHCIAP